MNIVQGSMSKTRFPLKRRRRRRRRQPFQVLTSMGMMMKILAVMPSSYLAPFCHAFVFSSHGSFLRPKSSFLSSASSASASAAHMDQGKANDMQRQQGQLQQSVELLAMVASGNNRREDDGSRTNYPTKLNDHKKLCMNDVYNSCLATRTLTPYHVLHPTAPMNTSTNIAHSRPRPLFRVLRLVQEALHVMLLQQQQQQQQQHQHSSFFNDTGNDRIWRMDHAVISETADPLAWLSQQKERLDSTYGSTVSQEALFYFASQKGDFEVAALGSVQTLHETSSIFDAQDDTLPASSRWYGGERFAPAESNDDVSDDWKEFGKKALWILPKIELVQRRRDSSSSSSTTSTVLAVHIRENDIADTYNFIQLLTENQAPRQPPTTLPPILSRDSNYNAPSRGRRVTKCSGDDDDAAAAAANDMMIDGQDHFEQAVAAALEHLPQKVANKKNHTVMDGATGAQHEKHEKGNAALLLDKVVLARKHNLHLGVAHWTSLSLLQRWKYGHFGEGGGHLFYLRPPSAASGKTKHVDKEFFGCTPERLFQIVKQQQKRHADSSATNVIVRSEALAGTRPRGATAAEDAQLLQELFDSDKDLQENRLTGEYIESAFEYMHQQGWVDFEHHYSNKKINNQNSNDNNTTTSNTDLTLATAQSSSSPFFVRRLLHVQHLCRTYTAKLQNADENGVWNVSRHLLTRLHPTPAVCGVPLQEANEFIRRHESSAFDRGFYSGPIGYIGRQEAHIVVAIRSGLVTHPSSDRNGSGSTSRGTAMTKKTAGMNELKGNSASAQTTISLYAGAGIVPGSTVKGEWAETNYKLAVISSLFPQSPITLQGAPTPNAAWATAFVEELIRNGVTQFYICPGSRSTPLVVAVARAVRTHGDVVHAVSVHDERAAAFRALGYARGGGGAGRGQCTSTAHAPAAVITSSGTAVANLYPAVVEASMDGVPLLLLTADRPYESRDTGANQAIDQIKVFSPTYIRWHRDILPPTHDVPISLALADAGHAVEMSRRLRGPVHLNVQFRENLAPDGGKIRNDDRKNAITVFNAFHFTSAPKFDRWSTTGDRFTKDLTSGGSAIGPESVMEIARLIQESKRGIIVVGNLRPSRSESQSSAVETISDFAEQIGFPIVAGVQSAALRFRSAAVILFAEHLLKCPMVADNMQPDLVIQIGAPLVSTEITKIISNAVQGMNGNQPVHHVLLHPHTPQERVDPEFTVTHKVSADIVPFLKQVSTALRDTSSMASELAPLVFLGRRLAGEMKAIIQDAAEVVDDEGEGEYKHQQLTEPEIILSLANSIASAEGDTDRALFLSNSMPIRDAEFLLYPFSNQTRPCSQRGPSVVGTNRGASGIDGIVSSALGFAEASQSPTTLVIGDVSALHDIGSLHSLANDATVLKQTPGKKSHPLTTIVVNNNGGGIFSFLPVARYGDDVSFEEFYGTPTNSFSFGKGAEAFNVAFRRAVDISSFDQAFKEAREQGKHSIVEAVVAGRQRNVATHRRITDSVYHFVANLLDNCSNPKPSLPRLSVKAFQKAVGGAELSTHKKTLVLLHGWMGDKSEWDLVGTSLSRNLPHDWNIIAVDLPGHGFSPRLKSSDGQAVLEALHLTGHAEDKNMSIDGMAEAVLSSLSKHHNIDQIDAIAGYSIGGRVATAILRRMEGAGDKALPKVILISTDPGRDKDNATENPVENLARLEKDDGLAARIISHTNKAILLRHMDEEMLLWDEFLDKWYNAPIWGSLSESPGYRDMKVRRCRSLQRNGRDLAAILSQCSPPRNHVSFRSLNQVHPNTLFLAGGLDSKYAAIGRLWEAEFGITYKELEGVGHALLDESAASVAAEMSFFLQSESPTSSTSNAKSANTEDVAAVPDRLVDEQSLESFGSRPEPEAPVDNDTCPGSSLGLRFETFSIKFSDGGPRKDSLSGIGWGGAAKASRSIKRRAGVIIQIASSTGAVGIGEVSPLPGLHTETLDDAIQQLVAFQVKMRQSGGVDFISKFEAGEALKLNGYLTHYLEKLADVCGIVKMLPSVRSGLEMALLGLAAQNVGQPMHQALTHGQGWSQAANLLPINGLIARGVSPGRLRRDIVNDSPSFPSLKVKVGHQTSEEDAISISQAFQRFDLSHRRGDGMWRADANQAWNESEAVAFASSLDGLEVHAIDRLEFIEEPLKKQMNSSGSWSLASQVDVLERFHMHSGIPYAIDESLAALALQHDFDFPAMEKELEQTFMMGPRGCAAFILKPTLLGFELSWQLARLARHKFGIGAVFSCSFDSGVGLAYTAFFGALSNAIAPEGRAYPHGIGTFTFFTGDTLTPCFASYVNKNGELNTASISRAVYGLTLDEMHSYFVSEESTKEIDERKTRDEDAGLNDEDSYETSSASVSSGAGISVALSINLPFAATVAHSRFTDLPQIPKWAPWVSSVAYQGKETEWRLNVRGVPLKWRATSQLIEGPCPGIQWESVSGLINNGVAEFIPATADSCVMKVKMSFVTPRIFSPVFQGVSIFLEEFVREKLLRWSLESFRDVVKADLAVERGDLELGDALFSAAEGKANAIEATLNSAPTVKDNSDPRWR